MTYAEAKLLVKAATGEDGRVRWEATDDVGWTVAHYAAQYAGLLPEDFDQWELADKNGHTVAHWALLENTLPKGFDRWEIANASGWIVAHEAVRCGHLPADFDRWEIADSNGWTVAMAAAEKGKLPDDVSDDVLRHKNKTGMMVAQIIISERGLRYSEVLRTRAKRIFDEEEQQTQGTDADDSPAP